MINTVVRQNFVAKITSLQNVHTLSTAEVIALMAEYIRNQMQKQAVEEVRKAKQLVDNRNGGAHVKVKEEETRPNRPNPSDGHWASD
jgi:hypothetical protein